MLKHTDLNMHEEKQYLNLISTIVDNGSFVNGRNGTTKAVFGESMSFSQELLIGINHEKVA